MVAVITAKAVEEVTGEHTLMGIRQLLLRDKDLERFESTCAQQLVKLEVLSLSRNRFRTLSHFQNFINLQELNMNFNQLESLEGLVAPNLQKLFLSNNRLTSIQHIGRFPRLTTLCLFRNLLPDLEEALSQLRALSRLRDVALDGNPCARHTDYRHRMVHGLPRLESLDEERVEALDREVAAMAMAKLHQQQQQQRPGTAPSRLGRRRAPLQQQPKEEEEVAGSKPDSSSPLRPTSESAASRRASESDPSLLLPLRHLNANPLVLGYLTQSACTPLLLSARSDGGSVVSEAPVSSRLLGRTEEPVPPRTTATAAWGADKGSGNDDEEEEEDSEEDEGEEGGSGSSDKDERATDASSSSSSSSPSVSSSSSSPCRPYDHRSSSSGGGGPARASSSDVSDPYVLIRKLLKTVEVLKQELQHNLSSNTSSSGASEQPSGRQHGPPLSARGVSAPSEDLEREVEQLRIENRMMWILKDENKALSARVQELEVAARERDELARKVERLTREREAAKGGSEEPRRREQDQRAAEAAVGCAAGLSMAEEKEEEEGDEEDQEILRLINRNARTLDEIREDMMQTKVELEVRAMAAEAAAAGGREEG